MPRADGLILADPSAGLGIGPEEPDIRFRVTADVSAFRTGLLGERPRIAVVCVPPGTASDVELVASVRRRRPRLRAMLLNRWDHVGERLDALRLGFDAALSMDVDPGELHGRIALLWEQTRETRKGHRLRIADGIELDTDSRELLRDDRHLHLRPKEFGLLDFLARHPGRTFTRRQLLDRVWHQDRDRGDDRTVDVHVRWLREKIEVDPEHPGLLLTVRGVGYRLEPGDD